MLMMKKILIEDINSFLENFSLKADVNCSSILVTGGTGLIGSVLVKCLLGLNGDVRITLPVRSLEKAKIIFPHNKEEVLAKRGGTNLPLVVGLSVAHVATLSIVFALMM